MKLEGLPKPHLYNDWQGWANALVGKLTTGGVREIFDDGSIVAENVVKGEIVDFTYEHLATAQRASPTNATWYKLKSKSTMAKGGEYIVVVRAAVTVTLNTTAAVFDELPYLYAGLKMENTTTASGEIWITETLVPIAIQPVDQGSDTICVATMNMVATSEFSGAPSVTEKDDVDFHLFLRADENASPVYGMTQLEVQDQDWFVLQFQPD